jgi:hypothetical protein
MLPSMLSLLAFAAPSVTPITLKWNPKAGDKFVYKITVNLETEGIKLDLTGKDVRSVIKADREAVLVTDESSMVLPDSTPIPLVATQSSFRPDGTLLELTAELNIEDGFRQARLKELVFPDKPVSIGDSWTASSPPDKQASMTGFKAKYTLVGEEKVGDLKAYRIEAKGGETGDSLAKTEMTYWVDETTGNPLHVHVKMTKTAFPGDQGRSVDLEEDDLIQ